MGSSITRRRFLQTSAIAAAGVGASQFAFGAEEAAKPKPKLTPKADAMILIWLPGGMAQTDMWDPKKFTPFRAGMKGNELLGTCKSIPTSADGIFLGEGMEGIASQMKHGSILRTLTSARNSARCISRRSITR